MAVGPDVRRTCRTVAVFLACVGLLGACSSSSKSTPDRHHRTCRMRRAELRRFASAITPLTSLRTHFSPTLAMVSAETKKPMPSTAAEALSGVTPTTAAGLFMAKYTPGSRIEAATRAITATNDSMSMAP